MMNKSIAFLLAIAGLALGASAEPNPACMKLPDAKKFRNESCCELPSIIEQKVMEDCWKTVSSTADSEAVKDCKSMECLFKRHNFLTANGSIDKAAADKYLNERLHGNDEWLKVVKTEVDHCLAAVEVDHDKMLQYANANQIKVARPEECSMKPTLVGICVSAKTFAKCPDKSWNQSPSCTEWKKYMETCTDSFENIVEFYKQLSKSG